MERTVIPSHEVLENRPRSSDSHQRRARTFSPGLRSRAILAGILAAALLTVLIGLGSRGFHWFDPTLIGYTVATIFATAAVTYKYSFWLARPPTGRYWRRSWQLFFSYENFRRYHKCRAYSYDFPDGPIRLRQLRDAVQLILKMWSDDEAVYEGGNLSPCTWCDQPAQRGTETTLPKTSVPVLITWRVSI